MNIKLKFFLKTQIKILVIETAILILSFAIMHLTVLYMSRMANIVFITLDSLILPAQFIEGCLSLITKNIYVLIIGSLIGHHLVYNIYYHFFTKYKIFKVFVIVVYLIWAINYIIIKLTF